MSIEVIGTLPAPYNRQIFALTANSFLNGFRYNIGAKTPDSPKDTLRKILALTGKKDFWVDLDGRQLRVAKWSFPAYGDIQLNRKVDVKLPAIIYFRGSNYSYIKEIRGLKIFVDPLPFDVIGQGQAVNIISNSLKVNGYLTKKDRAYIKAAKELGIHNYMLSFVEKTSDIIEVLALDSKAHIVAKIESKRGLDFVRNEYSKLNQIVRLMAARDDLYLSLEENDIALNKAVHEILDADSEAIAASRILTSLEKQEMVSFHDISDLKNLFEMGYTSFMLSDGLCSNSRVFSDAVIEFKKIAVRFFVKNDFPWKRRKK